MKRLSSKALFFMLLCLGLFPRDIFCQNSSLSQGDCDTSLSCSYNDDNLIYQTFNEFTYLLRTTVEPKDFNLDAHPYPLEKFQEPIVLRLKILPGCYIDQTAVKYEYLIGDSIFNFETTGLVEDRKGIWIHPPRSLIAEATFSPYFEYRFEQKKWRSGFIISNENTKISDKKLLWAKNKTTVAKDTLVRFKDEEIMCKLMIISTKHRGKTYHSTMLFNEKIGFVYIDVHFINGKQLSLELINMEPNFCKEK